MLNDLFVGQWEQKADVKLSANIRIGILLNCLEEGSALKEHLVMNSSRFTTWEEVKDEVVNIRRTQIAFRPDDAMDVGALEAKGGGKGGKGGKGAGKGGKSKGKFTKGGKGLKRTLASMLP